MKNIGLIYLLVLIQKLIKNKKYQKIYVHTRVNDLILWNFRKKLFVVKVYDMKKFTQ